MLTDKLLVITGPACDDSVAYAVAAHAQHLGAEVLLAASPGDHDRTVTAAASLPRPAPVVTADLTDPADLERLVAHLRTSWGRVDGAVHATGSPGRVMDIGHVVTAAYDEAGAALRAGAYAYAALARVVCELAPPTGAAIVGLDVETGAACPTDVWAGVGRAALEAVNRRLARELGPRLIRANLVVSGGRDGLAAAVAETACLLLSDRGRAVTGDLVHVGGARPVVTPGATDRPEQPSAVTFPPPTTPPTRQRLLAAFATLTSYGIAAVPAVGTDPDTTRTRLYDAILQRSPEAIGSYVFYSAPEDRCFDGDGHLRAPLTLHVSGEEVTRAVHLAFDRVGLRATPGPQPDTLLLATAAG